MNIVFTERAKRDWERLDHSVQNQLQKKLLFYAKSGNPLRFAERLHTYDWGEFRFRIGDWRIVFDVRNETLFVLRVGNRRDIYRKP